MERRPTFRAKILLENRTLNEAQAIAIASSYFTANDWYDVVEHSEFNGAAAKFHDGNWVVQIDFTPVHNLEKLRDFKRHVRAQMGAVTDLYEIGDKPEGESLDAGAIPSP